MMKYYLMNIYIFVILFRAYITNDKKREKYLPYSTVAEAISMKYTPEENFRRDENIMNIKYCAIILYAFCFSSWRCRSRENLFSCFRV